MRLAMRATVTELITVIFETVGANTGSAEERTRAFGAATHEIAKQATLGVQDALDDTRRDRASGKMPIRDGALLIAAGNASKTGSRILWTLGIGLGALALGLGVTLGAAMAIEVPAGGEATLSFRLRAPRTGGAITACFGLVAGEHWSPIPAPTGRRTTRCDARPRSRARPR